MTRTVLSPDRLGIKHYEHRALLEIRGLFASNTFIHDPDQCVDKPDGFNMNVSLDEGDCGTTGCIGGWMFAAMQRDRAAPCVTAHGYVSNYRSQALGPLFFPFCDIKMRDLLDQDGSTYDFPFDLLPPAFALAAIDNFLATGDPDWPSATGLRNIEVRSPCSATSES